MPLSCASGSLSDTVTLSANTTLTDETYTFRLAATGDGTTTDGTPDAVSVAPRRPPPAVDESGTLLANTTWGPQLASAYIIDPGLDVPAGVTLTIDPGTVVKAQGQQGPDCENGDNYCSISVEGSLVAVGTTSEPITFTSINDNSIGGTTGSGTPAEGDWSGFESARAGSLDLEFAVIKYAGAPGLDNGELDVFSVESVSTGSVTLMNDSLSSSASVNLYGSGAVDVTDTTVSDTTVYISGSDSPIVENNTVSNAPAFPYTVQSSALNFGLLTGNTASGSGPLGFVVFGTAVTSTLSIQPIPYIIDPGLDVPAGVTLTIDPGTVVKAQGQQGPDCENGDNYCSISVEGSLVAVGTTSEPITFTSINDNSIGGTTGSGTPAEGDWSGFESARAGSLDLEFAVIKYAGAPGLDNGELDVFSVESVSTGSVTLMNDSLSSSASVNLYGSGAVDVTDTTVSDTTVYISGSDSPIVENNTVSNAPAFPYTVQSSALNFGLLTGNTASGSGPLGFVVFGTAVTSTLSIQPIPYIIDPGLDVPAGVTLTIDPGTVVKAASDKDITVEGTLKAVGTTANPITFTSINDNSVGGATGSGSPAAGDWYGIADNSGSVDLQDAVVDYANVGLSASGSGSLTVQQTTFSNVGTAIVTSASSALLTGIDVDNASEALSVGAGSVTFRASLTNVITGVQACDWDSNSCAVDATYTYWGNSFGPGGGPDGDPTVCGAVWTNPYYTSRSDSTTATGGSPFSANCDGSATPDQQLASAEQSESSAESELEYECEYVGQSYCQQLQSDQKCLAGLISAGEAASEYAFTGPADVIDNGAEFIEENAPADVGTAAQGVSFVHDISGYVSTVETVVNALESCF
jgi:invasion protein IalB